MHWHEALEEIWAKSPPPGYDRGESLRRHTSNLMARLDGLAELRPTLQDHFELSRFWLILRRAAWLHDWGKAAPSFQLMLRGGPTWHHRHEVLSLLWIDWCCHDLEPTEATWVASIVVSHHKEARDIFELYPFGLAEEDDPITDLISEVDIETCKVLWEWQRQQAITAWTPNHARGEVPSPPLPPPWEQAVARVRTEGVERIRFWLTQFRHLVAGLESGNGLLSPRLGFLLRGFMHQADYTSSAHLTQGGRPRLTHGRILKVFSLNQVSLYEHQAAAAQTEGNTILIAPTGSGKTEAALLWASRQRRSSAGMPRLFYTLPYQASMNAMFDRLNGAFSGKVGLVHSRSLAALYQRFMDQKYSVEEAVRQAQWMKALARLHVQPVVIFSPYQMLKIVYRLKGHEAMLADYAQGVFVFDEIHAYEPRRLAMILETVKYLREEWGARFLVMSATLPAPVRNRVKQALGNPNVITAALPLYKAFSRHQVSVLSGDLLETANLERGLRDWHGGKSVLVTCNTVARAQAVYRAILESPLRPPGGEPILLHSRFNARDRLRKEQCILSNLAFGSVGSGLKKARPVMVVSTQVVEVSLDMDVDTIYSDPAPLEALIQRFGRVNRGRRMPLAPVYVFEEPADGQGIYDPALIKKALKVLNCNSQRPLDEAGVQAWLDGIYTGKILADWEASYESTATEFRTAFLKTLIPFVTDPELEEAFDRLFDGVEVLPSALVKEYLELNDRDPIGATQLLVPIRWGQYHFLTRRGRIRPRRGKIPPVVEVYYDPEIGLDFAKDYQGAS
ncbi:MAG: CRISPR-associated helicase Cas3' [Deltaproteobacteria bacterium]|nr:CRISPR-associated helicase Cas3' [Deltaproteobacteria bacterium]